MSEKKLENLENLELSEKELEEVAGGQGTDITESLRLKSLGKYCPYFDN